MSFKAGVLGFVAAAMIGGCGGDAAQGEDGQDGQDGESVALLQVPAGDKNCPTGGVRVTVGAEASYVCNGQTGATGSTGAAGTNGTNGTGAGGSSSFTPVGLLNCGVVVTMPNGTSAYLRYNIVTFTDDSTFVTCSADTTGVVSGSFAQWYAPWQVGAGARYCQLGSDASAPATSGYWEFALVNGGYRATYRDPGATVDGWFYAFTTQNCPLLTPPPSTNL